MSGALGERSPDVRVQPPVDQCMLIGGGCEGGAQQVVESVRAGGGCSVLRA